MAWEQQVSNTGSWDSWDSWDAETPEAVDAETGAQGGEGASSHGFVPLKQRFQPAPKRLPEPGSQEQEEEDADAWETPAGATWKPSWASGTAPSKAAAKLVIRPVASAVTRPLVAMPKLVPVRPQRDEPRPSQVVIRPAFQPVKAQAPIPPQLQATQLPRPQQPPAQLPQLRPPSSLSQVVVGGAQATAPKVIQVRPPVINLVQPAKPAPTKPKLQPGSTPRAVAPASEGLPTFQPGQRVSMCNFPPEWEGKDREELIALIAEKLSVFGALAGKPVLLTLATDGSKRAFAAFVDIENAKKAVEASSSLGFEISIDKVTPPSPTRSKPTFQGQAVRDPFQLKQATLYIDELEMPQRPEIGPSPTDREVWIDPLPDEDELAEWLQVFGAAEEVCRLPHPETGAPTERGYVLFKSHDSAQACVDSHAGKWSESERAMSSQLSLRRSVVRAYPESIVSAFLGRGGEDINALRKASGVWKLAVKGADLAMKGAPLGDVLAEQRLHFWAEGRPEAIEHFKAQLEKRLAEIHREIRNKLENLGDSWKLEQDRELAKAQSRNQGNERSRRKRKQEERKPASSSKGQDVKAQRSDEDAWGDWETGNKKGPQPKGKEGHKPGRNPKAPPEDKDKQKVRQPWDKRGGQWSLPPADDAPGAGGLEFAPPGYDPRYGAHPGYGGAPYDPRYDPRVTPLSNPFYDPRYDPRFREQPSDGPGRSGGRRGRAGGSRVSPFDLGGPPIGAEPPRKARRTHAS